jgi:hypothetical protein
VVLNAATILVLVLAAVAISRHAVADGRVELNGFLFFSLGFLYYWMFPLAFAANASLVASDGFSAAADVVEAIDGGALRFYAGMCVLCYAAFWRGYAGSAKRIPPRASYAPFARPAWGMKGAVVVAALLATVMAIPVRGHLFQGYHEELFDGYEQGLVADVLPRGAFVASVSMLFVICLMWASQTTSSSERPRDFFSSRALMLYFGFQVLVVSMGGRLYFVSNVLSLLAFATIRYGIRIRISRLALWSAVVVAVVGAAGVLRTGDGQVSWGSVITNVGQEPALTSLSLFAFLDAGVFPALNAPIFLLSDFTNLLPSSLFPDKMSWLLRPQDFGYTISMPLGGLHLFVSLLVNFGWLGTLAVFFGIGAALAKLRTHVTSWLGCVVYSTVSGWVAFSLFRDPLSVSLVKNVLQVAILTPVLAFYGLEAARGTLAENGDPPASA